MKAVGWVALRRGVAAQGRRDHGDTITIAVLMWKTEAEAQAWCDARPPRYRGEWHPEEVIEAVPEDNTR